MSHPSLQGVEDVSAFLPPTRSTRHENLRARIALADPRSLSETDVLELLLGERDPYRAAPMAAALLNRFGGLARVLGSTISELRPLTGPDLAGDLVLVHDIARRLLEVRVQDRCLLTSLEAVKDYLRHSLAGQARESCRVLFLDNANHLISDELMGEGTINHAPVYPREIMRRALELNAGGCVLVHNHPSGQADPSQADIHMTRQVEAAGRSVGVVVHDHLLVAGDQVVSFKTQRLF